MCRAYCRGPAASLRDLYAGGEMLTESTGEHPSCCNGWGVFVSRPAHGQHVFSQHLFLPQAPRLTHFAAWQKVAARLSVKHKVT